LDRKDIDLKFHLGEGMNKKLMIFKYFMLFNFIIVGTHVLIMTFQPNLWIISKVNEANPINFIIPDQIKEERNPYHWHMIYFFWNLFVSIINALGFLIAKKFWIDGDRKNATGIVIYAVGMSLFKTSFCISLMTEWGYSNMFLFIIYLTKIVPHGIFEIPAISLVLSFMVISFKSLEKEDTEFVFWKEFKDLFRNPIFQTSIVLLAIAAPIEAYITPHCLRLFIDFSLN